jgi:regulatory protein
MAEAIRANPVEAAREAALRLLEHTRRTRDDLARRLRQRDFDAATIETVLERLAAVGLVDDVEYARAYLAERWGRRAAGWRRLEADLRRKGIAPADIVTARERLERETGAADEVTLARRVVAQSARRMERLEPPVRRQRLWALLARRGFDGDVIEQALRDNAPADGDDTGAD